eukprot:763873-Hanusia_phi.AAC.3
MLENEEEQRRQWDEKLKAEKASSQENLIVLEKRLRVLHENEIDDLEQRHTERLDDVHVVKTARTCADVSGSVEEETE